MRDLATFGLRSYIERDGYTILVWIRRLQVRQ